MKAVDYEESIKDWIITSITYSPQDWQFERDKFCNALKGITLKVSYSMCSTDIAVSGVYIQNKSYSTALYMFMQTIWRDLEEKKRADELRHLLSKMMA